jgi:molybdate transport system substrate-binding protein
VDRRRILLAGLAAAAGGVGSATGRAQSGVAGGATRGPVVFAAASLREALDEVATAFERQQGGRVVRSYAASSALARQIEAGAPADVFLSADLEWMDYLAERKLIDPGTRANLLGNRLVLIAPVASGVRVDPALAADYAGALGRDGRLAMGDPAHVPAGRYAKASLERLRVWPAVESRLARTENVRVALALVARGEVPLGVVYRTDALAEPKVQVVATLPLESHPPIVYPAALVASSRHPFARTLLAYLGGPGARAVFERYGFAGAAP